MSQGATGSRIHPRDFIVMRDNRLETIVLTLSMLSRHNQRFLFPCMVNQLIETIGLSIFRTDIRIFNIIVKKIKYPN